MIGEIYCENYKYVLSHNAMISLQAHDYYQYWVLWVLLMFHFPFIFISEIKICVAIVNTPFCFVNRADKC